MSSHTFIFNVPQPIEYKPYSQLKIDGKHGWLKKKIKKKFFRIAWEKKLVVLRDGCLYIFKNEGDGSYEKAFSLFGYNEISKAPEVVTKEAAFPFQICYALDSKEQVKYFSADSQTERSEWMIAIRNEMLKVHRIDIEPDTDQSSGDTDVPISSRDFFDKVKSICSSGTEADSDLEDVYHFPREDIPSLPLPPTIIIALKTENVSNGHSKKPNVPPKPLKEKKFNQFEVQLLPNLESSARWNGTPEQGKRILVKYGREGSYMIRRSKDGCDVLLVISDYFARKYKIFKENDNLFLAKKDKCFDDINSLILHYRTHPLPNRNTKLKDPYTVQQYE